MNNIDFISAKFKKQNISDETCLEMFPLTSAYSRHIYRFLIWNIYQEYVMCWENE